MGTPIINGSQSAILGPHTPLLISMTHTCARDAHTHTHAHEHTHAPYTGMHGIFKRPVVIGDKVEIRPMMYVALTYDHRIVDGGQAVGFLKDIKNAVEDPVRLLLEL